METGFMPFRYGWIHDIGMGDNIGVFPLFQLFTSFYQVTPYP